MSQPNRFKVALLAALCAACQAVTSTPTPRADPSPTSPPPTATPVPAIQVISHSLVEGSNPGDWRVIGLVENRGSTVIAEILLSVTLHDAAGRIIERASSGVSVSNLVPGEAGPFFVAFEVSQPPADARVEVLDFASSVGSRAEIETELNELFIAGSGELAILGIVSNTSSEDVRLDSLSFLGHVSDGRAKTLATMRFGPERLAPGETTPFLAIAPENLGAVRWTTYHDGLISEDPVSGTLEMHGEPTLQITAQGAPFVIGTIVNSGRSDMVGSVLIAIYEETRLIGLWEVETPRPLGPREQLSFSAFGFPGVSLRFDPSDPGTVRLETRIDSKTTDQKARLVVLPVDVSSFLSVGSAMFIRGIVQNPLQSEVESAAVYVEVRSTLGDLVTAGWSKLGILKPGSSTDFVLDLPIPVGMDATTTEYDLRAIGFEAEP